MKKSTVHLFIFDTMSDWEYGYAVAGINNRQFQKTPGAFEVKTVGLSDVAITSIGGLRVTPAMEAGLKSARNNPPDGLAFLISAMSETPGARNAREKLRRSQRRVGIARSTCRGRKA